MLYARVAWSAVPPLAASVADGLLELRDRLTRIQRRELARLLQTCLRLRNVRLRHDVLTANAPAGEQRHRRAEA